jgi:putative colanic acid biosynthesis acetyltransferase WcaF
LKTQLDQFNTDWYKNNYNSAGFFKNLIWYLFNSIFINSYLPIPIFIKLLVLRCFGAKIGDNITLKPNVNIKYPWLLTIGNNVWIGENVWIDNLAKVTIADNVCISQGAMLLCGNHDYKKSTFDMIIGEIVLENGVWIGAKAIVCPKVIALSHSVLTTGSVAVKNLQAYGIYQGNPATKIREREIS